MLRMSWKRDLSWDHVETNKLSLSQRTERQERFKNVYRKITTIICSVALRILGAIHLPPEVSSSASQGPFRIPLFPCHYTNSDKWISTTCLLGIILVGSEIRRDLSLGETSVGLGETLKCLGETLHGRNSLWAKPVVTTRTFFYFPWRFELSGVDCKSYICFVHHRASLHLSLGVSDF